MNKILIDLTSVNEDNRIAVQGIKIFLSKNKNTNIDIVGNIDHLLTIKDHKQVKIYSLDELENKLNPKFANIKDHALALVMSLLISDNEYKGLVTYSKKREVIEATDLGLTKTNESPLFIATFANFKTHRVTCIGDLGYKNNPTNEDYLNYLNTMKNYMKNVFKKENPEFKILALNEIEANPLVNIFKSVEGYKGTLEGKDLFKCDTDIVIGNPHTLLSLISGINHGISIYDEYIQSQVKKNFGLRYFSYPMFKSVFNNFHFEIDQKLTSGGNILLGYNKNIIVIDPNTIKQGVQVCIDLANKLESI